MKHKRLLGVIGAFVLLCTGCSNNSYDQKAIDDYIASSKEITKMDSANIDAKMFMNMTDDETTVKAKITFNGDFLIKENDLQMKINAAISANGLSIGDLNIYMKDQTMYVDILGTKQKTSLEKEMTQFLDAYKEALDHGPVMDEEYIKETFKEFKYEDQEKKIISFVMNSDKMMKEALENNPELSDTQDAKIDEIRGTMSFQDGVMKEFTMSIPISSTMGQKIDMEFRATMNEINKIDSIEFPDFSDYVEADLTDGFNADAYIGLPEGGNQSTDDLNGEDF